MKERLKTLLVGILIGALLVPNVFASIGTLTKELSYNNIKITLNGEEIIPTDANGSYVEPFIIDGTTYLPVRAVANALNLDVDWDANTNTVVLSDETSTGNELEKVLERYVLFHDGLALVPINGKYGYINTDGEIVIEPIYGLGSNGFSEGLAAVNVDGKYGYINTKGEMVIAPQFEDARDFSEGLASVKLNGDYGYINRKGEMVIDPVYAWQEEGTEEFSNGLAWVDTTYGDGSIYGCINRKGEMVIAPQYSAAGAFSDGLTPVSINGKIGYINTKGEVVVEPRYTMVKPFMEGMAPVFVGEFVDVYTGYRGEWGFMNTKGELVIATQFENVSPFIEGVAVVQVNDKYGAINTKGEFVIEPVYDIYADSYMHTAFYYKPIAFFNGLLPVGMDGRYGVINTEGEWVISPKYSYIDPFMNNTITLAYQNGRQGVINTKGEVVIPFGDYESVEVSSDGYVTIFTDKSTYDIYNTDGKRICQNMNRGWYIENGCIIIID